MRDSIININFSNAVKQAERLDSVVSQLESAAAMLASSMDALGTSWKGESADDYRKQGMDVQNLLLKDIKYIRNISKGIKETASVYRKNEMQKLDSEKES